MLLAMGASSETIAAAAVYVGGGGGFDGVLMWTFSKLHTREAIITIEPPINFPNLPSVTSRKSQKIFKNHMGRKNTPMAKLDGS